MDQKEARRLTRARSYNPHSARGALAAQLSRVPSLEAFRRRPPVYLAAVVMGRRLKPFTIAVDLVRHSLLTLRAQLWSLALQRSEKPVGSLGHSYFG